MGFSEPWEDVVVWLEAGLSVAAALALLCAGFALAAGARRKANKGKGAHAPQLRGFGAGLRLAQVRWFRSVASQIVQDAHASLASAGRVCRVDQYEARTMIPLVSEARKMGEGLLATRRKWHVLVAPRTEYQVEHAILDLIELEARLKAIPRAVISIEDVVAGRFD